MLVPLFGPKQSLSDNAVDKSLYFTMHATQKSEWCGLWLPSCNNNSKATPNFKFTWLQYFTCYAQKSCFNQYLFSKAEWKTKLNQVNLCLCQYSLRLNDVFNFLTLLADKAQLNTNNRNSLMPFESPQHIT